VRWPSDLLRLRLSETQACGKHGDLMVDDLNATVDSAVRSAHQPLLNAGSHALLSIQLTLNTNVLPILAAGVR
jgi:hypothetical protein